MSYPSIRCVMVAYSTQIDTQAVVTYHPLLGKGTDSV